MTIKLNWCTVHLEEQVNDLKKELEDVKVQGGKKGDREEGLQKQVQVRNLFLCVWGSSVG